MDTDYLTQWFALGYPAVASLALGMARAMGMVLITPVFNRLGMTGLLRSAVTLAIAVPVAPALLPWMAGADAPGGLMLAGLLIKETMVGLVLGVIFGVPFWAAEAAGELIDLQRGSTMSQLLDPLAQAESGVSATLLIILLAALFFMSGGFLLMLEGFYQSYGPWPADSYAPVLTPPMALALVALLDQVMGLAVMMVAPLMVAVLVADIMMAYLSRMAPNLHVFDLSLPVKNLIFAVLMVLYLVFLVPHMVGALGSTPGLTEWLAGQAPP